jgi:hypothetical protein
VRTTDATASGDELSDRHEIPVDSTPAIQEAERR